MVTLKTILTVVFAIVCIVLTVLVLMQEGKSAGLGAISGAAETYWGKNKGRSMEGALEKGTRVLVVAFLVIAVLLIPISSRADQVTDTQNANTVNDSGSTPNVSTTDQSGDTDDQADADNQADTDNQEDGGSEDASGEAAE